MPIPSLSVIHTGNQLSLATPTTRPERYSPRLRRNNREWRPRLLLLIPMRCRRPVRTARTAGDPPPSPDAMEYQ